MILEKILKLAEKNSISVSCLEKTLGFGNGTIKKWGESSPSVNKLKKVADYFGVSIEYFLEQEVREMNLTDASLILGILSIILGIATIIERWRH